MHIKKGDKVKVLTGAHRGATGVVLKSIPKEHRVVIEGVNVKKKHQRARRSGEKGQMVEKPYPVAASNVEKIK